MKLRALLLSAFFFSGFAALVYEVMFTKGLILFVGGTVYAYSLILTAFLTGMGLGSLLAKRFQKTDLATLFAYVQLGIGAYGLLFVPILNNLDVSYLAIYNISGGSFGVFHSLLLLLAYLVLLVPTLLMGMTFPVVSRLIARAGNIGTDVGKLFCINTLGGVAGAFVGGFVLLPVIGLERAILVAVALNLLISAVVFVAAGKGGRVAYGGAFAVVALLAAFLFDAKVDPYRFGIYHQHGRFETASEYREALARERAAAGISFSDFGLYGSVVVKEEGPVKVLMIDGKVDAGTGLDVPTQLLLGYIPGLMHPDPKDVAIIGLGSGITLAAVESLPVVERIDVLELNPTVVEAAGFFEVENRNALADERVELTVGDARDVLSTTDRTYDVIISEPSNPWIDGEVFLFTREFYSVVAERLNEGGLFLQWIGAYDFNPEDLKVSLRTLETAFPHVQAWADARGVDFFLLASKEPIARDYEGIAAAMREPIIRSDFEAISALSNRGPFTGPDVFFSFFVADDETLDSYASGAPVNTDNRPIIEFRTARNRVGRTTSSLGAILAHTSGGGATTTVSPPVTAPVSGDVLSFLGLNATIDMPLAEVEYAYEYTTRGEDSASLRLALELTKHVVFGDGERLLVVRGHPREAEPPVEEFAAIASSLGSAVLGTIEIEGQTRYLTRGETISAMLWHCNRHLYVTYFEHPPGASLPSMFDTLASVRCATTNA
ncbi:MAG: fused MFS/spermidine synthase [Acidobacteriota bacterium]|nr:fused MFS/spermidine synthase [Acidobacteriota bacterium]MDE2924584.1 fused MFS/spermidine synthase [Acidobacteriota bacterium]MDE3264234.1 fused MFS/spermidine synthase [Acidobacteriota bacterium]